MSRTNEERIDQLRADTITNIGTLAGRLKTELANVARLERDLEEARVLNGELAKTNDSLEADIAVLKARLEIATKRVSSQGATRIPIADKPTAGLVDPRDVVGSMELTTVAEQKIASLLASGHRMMVEASVMGDISGLHNVAFVAVPAPDAMDKVPVQLTVKFEKTPEELCDLVLDELKKQNRSISDGVERVKLNVWSLMQIVEEDLRMSEVALEQHDTQHNSGQTDALNRVLKKIKEKAGDSMGRIQPLGGWLLEQVATAAKVRERGDTTLQLHWALTGKIEAFGELADRAVREGWVRTKS